MAGLCEIKKWSDVKTSNQDLEYVDVTYDNMITSRSFIEKTILCFKTVTRLCGPKAVQVGELY